ncbi:MAG: hypothetical protein LBJ01_01665 [Tannerella sp.]|jgi:hypothetical protein|nr:hypothetical protein [Tannerella sp.]
MKKLFLTALVAALVTATANAQSDLPSGLSKGSFVAKGKTTGFGLSILTGNGSSQTEFNLGAEGAYFVIDRLAITAEAGIETEKVETGDDDAPRMFNMGAGARYYLSPQGWFAGAGFLIKDVIGDYRSLTFKIEGGYTYYIRDNIFIEPGVQFSKNFYDEYIARMTKIDFTVGIGFKF